MIIEKDLSVTPEEFYDYMIYSVVEQVKNTFGREIDPDTVKSGYTHKTSYTNKKTGSKRTTRYTVKRAVPGKEFYTVFTSADNKTKVKYVMTPTEKGMHLYYSQETEFTDPKMEPHGLYGSLDQYFLKRKLAKSIKQVEKTILKAR